MPRKGEWQAMTNVALYVPEKEVSAWVTETDPKDARAWLASLPLADAGESARDIYQALYTLNRLALVPHTRLELMELYREPVSTVSSVLQHQFGGLAMPLPFELRQMAEFIRQLQMEMAIGYKCAIQDLGATRISWGRKNQLVLASERAMVYLGQALLRSYQVYMPQPTGVWTEIHTLFRYAEEQEYLGQSVETSESAGDNPTILRRYQQILLLGLCSPYQLPQNECNHVNAFLEEWADKAVIGDQLGVTDPAGHFLINLSLDAPPVPLVQHRATARSAPELRVLNTLEVARAVHDLSKRLDDGEPAKALGFSEELSDASVREMLRRMIKFWGLTPQRRFARTQTRGHLSVCTGINALHFFGSGGKPFAPPVHPPPESQAPAGKPAQVAKPPNDPRAKPARGPAATPRPGLPKWLAETKLPTPESYPVDRWRLQDESARGLLLLREGEMLGQLRVGDVLGMQSGGDLGNWHVGVIRWIKSPQPRRVEMGVERLAPKVSPVALRVSPSVGRSTPYVQGLLLPAMPVLQRPAALLAPRGLYEAGRALEMVLGNGPSRMLRPIKLLERTATFDLIVFVDIFVDTRSRNSVS
ncbi:MAG: hypothetical protein R3268_02180 [Acidiferrobacterales bacterium]|nr:hypothetical protein [Acidiferrobacterales bacterium]